MIKSVFVRIETMEASERRIVAEVERRRARGEPAPGLELSFPSLADFRMILSPERDRLLQVLQSERPRSIYHLAKLLGRRQSGVQQDVTLLARLGLIRLAPGMENGRRVLQPIPNFEEIHFVRNYRAEAEAERAPQDSPRTSRTRRPRGALRGPPPRLSVKPQRVAAAKA